MSFFDKTADSFAKYMRNQLQARGVSLRDITDGDMALWYRTFLSNALPDEIRLSGVSPDFEEVYSALLTEVTKFESWRDASVSSTGSMFLAIIAAGITYNQTAIIRGTQEGSLDTARLPYSIYAATRDLGVRIERKTPSYVEVNLQNSSLLTEQIIPAYTRWTVGREAYYNRNVIAFRQGEQFITGVQLFQGEILEEIFESSGLPYQSFEAGLPDFTTSNEDVVCLINSVEWERADRGIWSYPYQNVFQEMTSARGTVEIRFGNGTYGNIPPKSSEIRIRYARTAGTIGATASINQDVTCQINPAVTGTTTSNSIGGGSEKDIEFYRRNAPQLHIAMNKAVTQDDYVSLIRTYPGVVDAAVRGQQHIDPTNPIYFNRVQVVALKENGASWSLQEWDDFEKWLQDRSLIGVQLNRSDPKPVVIDVSARVFCLDKADLKSVRMALSSHLKSTFKIQHGSLGKSMYRDDIHKALRTEPTTRGLITHVILDSPSFDAVVQSDGFVQLRNIELFMNYSERTSLL